MRLSPSPAIAAAAAALIALPAPGGQDQIFGTLNFRNETVSRIVTTVAEDPGNNVKEVEWGDMDNDGDPDVAIAAAGGVFGLRLNQLYRNDGGVFQEVSGAPVIPGFSTIDLSRHLFFRDIDADGWNDLIVVNDELAGGGRIKFYMNQHPGDVFTGYVEDGANRMLPPWTVNDLFQASCGGVSVDVDNDDDFDIYSGNYPSPSQDTLFLNDGTGHFSIVTSTQVPVDSDYTIDVASADMNGDGRLDMLISNHSPNWLYYNDLQDAGEEGPGDYRYGPTGTDGKVNLGTGGADGAMEPGDFNNDDLMDFYWTNRAGTLGDRIYVNTGNDASGKAVFEEVVPPLYTTQTQGNKIAVGDLNGDGRADVVVPMVTGRPAILRNTSVNGIVSFVDWSPASVFPGGTTHQGHHAGLFDTGGDGDVDIFLGARNGNFLFENVAGRELLESELGAGDGGTLDNVFNRQPTAIVGTLASGGQDDYVVPGIGSGALVSLVLRGADDYELELLDGSMSVVASSDRGGAGVEEALEADGLAAGTYTVRVTVLDCGPTPGDGDANCAIDVNDLVGLITEWGPTSGPYDVNGDGVTDVNDLVALILAWGPVENEYVLEILSRDD